VRRGVADDRSLLAAETAVLQQRDAAATLDAQAISTQIALTKALGGGYRLKDAPSGDQPAAPTSPINVEKADSR